MKRTRSIHTPNMEAHRELSASPVPVLVPEVAKSAPAPLDASLFKGWKPNTTTKSNPEINEKEFRSPMKPSDALDKVTYEHARPTLPQFKPKVTELVVPGFEAVAIEIPSDERIQLYKDLRGSADSGSGLNAGKKRSTLSDHGFDVGNEEVQGPREASIQADAISKTVEGLAPIVNPQTQGQNPKRLVFDPPKKTESEDLNGERISTITVKMFKNEVIQEHPGFGNRAKFRLTVNRVGMIEIYGKISKVLESPTETIPRLVLLIADDSSDDPLEAFYYDQDASVLVNQINFSNWYQFVGQAKFQSDRTPILHLFSFREVVNLGELEYSKAMVNETLKYLPQ